MNDWDGHDRRAPEGVIIAVMNHVQETLDRHTAKMDTKLDVINGRLDSLMQSISSYMDKQEEIEKAFLKTQDGMPDYSGHFYDHDHRRRIGIWWDGIKDKAITKVIEWGVVAFVAWVGYALWEAFLKGPKQ